MNFDFFEFRIVEEGDIIYRIKGKVWKWCCVVIFVNEVKGWVKVVCFNNFSNMIVVILVYVCWFVYDIFVRDFGYDEE